MMVRFCPTVLAENPHQYREQIERVAAFATCVHIDLSDGVFSPTTTIGFGHVWWPHSMQADLHIMYKKPGDYIDKIIKLNPRLVILHAEAEGNFIEIAETLRKHDILAGVALLADTPVKKIKSSISVIDHVLVFSGKLGHFGGKFDKKLLSKVREIKNLKPDIEIGWDGGINDTNAKQLVDGGVDVLNVGGYIQRSENPLLAFKNLQSVTQ
jgi:ribulose-phosphate 3-epimerase